MQLPTSRTGLKLLWQLFWSFFKISPISFGGGYAMLPMIEREVMGRRGWLTSEEMAEAIAISGAAPGGIGVNAAAFIGYKVMGLRGLVAAVAGIMLPTIVIMLGVVLFFGQMKDHPKVIGALQGIQMAVIALIAYAGLSMARSVIVDKTTASILTASLIMLLLQGIHPIVFIPMGIVAGIIIVSIKKKRGLGVHFNRSPVHSVDGPSYTSFYYGDGI